MWLRWRAGCYRANAVHIGAVFEQRGQLWYDLPVRDSFELIRDLLYGIPNADYRQRLGTFTDLLDMADLLDAPVRFLSLGQRMRGDLVAALLHSPEAVFLDEPTVGLSVVAKRRIREFVADINERLGTTVILTTHDMDDVEALCRRVIMIDRGTGLFDGSLDDLRHRYMRERTLTVTPAADIDPALIRVDGAAATAVDGKAVLTHDPAQVGPRPDRRHHRGSGLHLPQERTHPTRFCPRLVTHTTHLKRPDKHQNNLRPGT